MRVLVTGATGFVGGAVARRLLNEGLETCVLVRDASGAPPLEQAGAVVQIGSIADPNEVLEAARGCEAVIHAAAEPSHRAAPRALNWVNVAGTENVLNAAGHAGCRRLVYVSCADVTLANCDRVHWNEDRGLTGRPLDPHGYSKQLAEEIVLSSCAAGFETTALRPAILWGPGDSSLLPAVCREARRGGVRLYGGGENLISTTYIDHLVDAVCKAMDVGAAVGRPYYVTDGVLIEAREFFGALCSAVGLPPPRSGLPYPMAYAMAWLRRGLQLSGPWPTDVVRRGRSTVFDDQRAVNELDYTPRLSLEEGMREVAAWVQRAGGPDRVASFGRTPASARAVDAQVAAAGGDG